MAKAEAHKWEFKARFRRHAFGWRSQPAITRVKQAVAEIRKVARKEPLVAAEGAVTFFERVSPALEQVDSSSGAIGTAVGHAITELVPIIASAPADVKTREAWLERLFEAHQADEIPYIERLADHWGDLCASKEVASAWADRLLWITKRILGPDREPGAFFHGTSACLSALFHAGRHEELLELLSAEKFWHYRRWAVKALAATGREEEAISLAESLRGPFSSDLEVDSLCEEILLSSGRADEAYERYALRANRAGTYLAAFRAVIRSYPEKTAAEVLAGLVASTPGNEGKWFAAAKEAGLYGEALALARRAPCDPKTLTRAARDYAEKEPEFAVNSGLLALHWLVAGYGYEITGADVQGAYRSTMAVAERHGKGAEVKERIRTLVASEKTSDRFVWRVLGRELQLP